MRRGERASWPRASLGTAGNTSSGLHTTGTAHVHEMGTRPALGLCACSGATPTKRGRAARVQDSWTHWLVPTHAQGAIMPASSTSSAVSSPRQIQQRAVDSEPAIPLSPPAVRCSSLIRAAAQFGNQSRCGWTREGKTTRGRFRDSVILVEKRRTGDSWALACVRACVRACVSRDETRGSRFRRVWQEGRSVGTSIDRARLHPRQVSPLAR